MFALWKTISGFYKSYRIIIFLITIGGFALTAFNYVSNHAEMKRDIAGYKEAEARWAQTISDLRQDLAACDQRVAQSNDEKREQAAEYTRQVQEITNSAIQSALSRQAVQRELDEARFHILELIRDDEDVADWVDGAVPAAVGMSFHQRQVEGMDPER